MAKEKYYIKESPAWIERVSPEDLVIASQKNERISELKKSGKAICYVYKEAIKTSNDKNEFYLLRAWDLSTAEMLQGASVMEFTLTDRMHLVIHKVAVIRGGIFIDKKPDMSIRVLDDEGASSRGSIQKLKKVNCLIHDIRLNDIIAFEYSTISVFKEQDMLDKKYFRYFKNLPFSNWFYGQYSFTLIHDRFEEISLLKKHFRNGNERVADSTSSIKKGESFTFRESDIQNNYRADEVGPYIEIATKSSWKKVNSDIVSSHAEFLKGADLIGSHLYSSLNLKDPDDVLDDKIQRIAEYAQNEIVYLYDAEVMHGQSPQLPEKTIAFKSGDCKAKSLLLAGLLRSIGIKADVILVNYSYDYFIPESLPSPFVFNHAIVRARHGDRDFFVDPTWTDQSGILADREEPAFFNFLPLDGASGLMKRIEALPPYSNIDKKIDITLKDGVGRIRVLGTYRRGSANLQRRLLKSTSQEQITENQTKFLFESLMYPQEKQSKGLFKDTKYRIISDDTRTNKIVTEYECTMPYAYQQLGRYKLFKFYHYLDISTVLNHRHAEYPCSNFFAYPIEYRLVIASDLFINKSDSITKRNTEIKNDYFAFSNKKTVSFKKIEIVSSFRPKTYGYIDPSDFEKVKKDYLEINKSNFGVGIIYFDLLQYVRRKWYLMLVLFVLIKMIQYLLVGQLD